MEFTATYRLAGSSVPLVSSSTLQFIDPEQLCTMLEDCSFRVDGWFGDWDRTPVTASSPEVIVVATRPD